MPENSSSQAIRGSSETSQVRPRQLPSADLMRMARSIVEAADFTKLVSNKTDTFAPVMVACQMSPKVAEAHRQISRLTSALAVNGVQDAPGQCESIGTAVAMLHGLSVGALPVPIASWELAKGASLFFDQDGFYGDLEVNGNSVEYFLKSANFGGTGEIYGTEKVEDGRVPPSLLVALFMGLAKNEKVL